MDKFSKLFSLWMDYDSMIYCIPFLLVFSEHSRHWFFKGRMVVDGVEHEDSLFKMVMNTQDNSNQNNVIKFSDNSR